MAKSTTEAIAVVTGAAGFLGAAVVTDLLARGFTVRALVRSSRRAWRLDAVAHDQRVVRIEQDIRNDVDEAVMRGASVVVHAAAATGVGRTREDCDAITAGGTERMLAAALRAGVTRFVHVSSLSVYGMSAGSYDEGAPMVRAGDPYGDSKVAAEEHCARYAAHLPVTVVRPALIVGAGDTGFFPMFLDMLRRRRFPLLNGGHAAARLVMVDDVAELIGRCCVAGDQHGAAVGAGPDVYNCCSTGELSWRAFAERVCDHFGFARPTFAIGATWPYRAARALEALERFGIRPPLRTAELQFLGEQRSYPMGRARSALGFEPRSASACVELTLPHFTPATDATTATRAHA